MTRQEKIAYIKSFKKPPFSEDDIYNLRYPWQKFGCVSSGICMCWGWWRDDVIEEQATDKDVDVAYKETCLQEFAFDYESARRIAECIERYPMSLQNAADIVCAAAPICEMFTADKVVQLLSEFKNERDI